MEPGKFPLFPVEWRLDTTLSMEDAKLTKGPYLGGIVDIRMKLWKDKGKDRRPERDHFNSTTLSCSLGSVRAISAFAT